MFLCAWIVQRKIGRPIAYTGDPRAPELTDQERRRIKRQISNRVSARRVKQKHKDTLKSLESKVRTCCFQSYRIHFAEILWNLMMSDIPCISAIFVMPDKASLSYRWRT